MNKYVARRGRNQLDLYTNINRWLEEQEKNNWAIAFEDGTIAPIEYYQDWLLVQYALDVKQLSYESLLTNDIEKAVFEKGMMDWFNRQIEKPIVTTRQKAKG